MTIIKKYFIALLWLEKNWIRKMIEWHSTKMGWVGSNYKLLKVKFWRKDKETYLEPRT